jgi:hypothetical protein
MYIQLDLITAEYTLHYWKGKHSNGLVVDLSKDLRERVVGCVISNILILPFHIF